VTVLAEAEVRIPLFSDELRMSYSSYSLSAITDCVHIYPSVMSGAGSSDLPPKEIYMPCKSD